MKSSIIEKAKKIIENKHYEAEREALNNKEEALKDPEFKKLYLAYINNIIESAKIGEENPDEEKKLKKAVEKRLKELKLGSVEPEYYCQKCKDNGLTQDGKYCDCFIDEVNKLLKAESGFLELEDFENTKLDIFEANSQMKTLYAKMQQWCNSNFAKTIVYLGGETGVGKTHLIKCMANELIKRHKLVLLTTSFAMHQDFVRSFSTRDAEEKQNIISKYIDAEILFIDDLGTELRNPNVTVNYLYQVLNERKMKKRPTIITSNLTLADINEYYDERISSRIADQSQSICVYIQGEDLRHKKF